MIIKFERVQWPVGHGGFHTGRLKCGSADFRYFFDCGAISKEGKALISEKLNSAEFDFDFGVISHFDRDHYSELASAKVKVLFLPYMTPVDKVLLALADQKANNLRIEEAFEGFKVLKELEEQGTRICMVDGRGEARGDTPQGDTAEPQSGFSLDIPYVRNTSNMGHEDPVTVQQSKTKLLYFKFFNHRMEDVSQAFAKKLEDAIKSCDLLNMDNDPYKSVDDFIKDVTLGDVLVVEKNGKAMQRVYKSTLGTHPYSASPITPSNLSSLTMFSSVADYRWLDRWPCRFGFNSVLRVQGSRREISDYRNGWMLTGDLELTHKTWPAFNDHYFCELSKCVVFNVPHHGSGISLCDEAVAFLAGQFFVMSVNSEDGKHPDEALTDRLKRHGVNGQQSVTTAWESMVATEILLMDA